MPEKNGVAEGMNSTLVELVRSITFQNYVYKLFWAEAPATSSYVRNHVTTRRLPPHLTANNLWMKRMPQLENLREIGSLIFYVLPLATTRRLDILSRPVIFIGYYTARKWYRLWDENLKKLIIFRIVKLDDSPDSCTNPCSSIVVPTVLLDGIISVGGPSSRISDKPLIADKVPMTQ